MAMPRFLQEILKWTVFPGMPFKDDLDLKLGPPAGEVVRESWVSSKTSGDVVSSIRDMLAGLGARKIFVDGNYLNAKFGSRLGRRLLGNLQRFIPVKVNVNVDTVDSETLVEMEIMSDMGNVYAFAKSGPSEQFQQRAKSICSAVIGATE
jgi:hypothetical protein